MNSLVLVTVLQALLLCCYACYFGDYKRYKDIHTDYCDKKLCGSTQTHNHTGCDCNNMQWDTELELLATLHSRRCVLRRDDCFAVPRFPSPGQAIGWVEGDIDKLADSIYFTMAVWFAEHKKSSSAQIQSYEAIDGTEHFTQMVNDRADRIGCGLMWVQKERFLLVCNYAKSCVDSFYVYDPAPKPTVGCETGRNTINTLISATKLNQLVTLINLAQ